MSNISLSIIYSISTIAFLFLFFVLVEPSITYGVQTQFTVSQTVTSEIAIATPASDIVLSPSLDSVVGGTATGSTQIVIKTNNRTGYSMTMNASSSLGMIGNASSTQYIPAYVTVTAGVPDYSFNVPVNKAYFGYTVEASTTSDLASSFKDSAGACNAVSGSDTSDACWMNAETSPFTVVNRTSMTALSGATTTLKFKVVINANPSPGIPDDTYVATTTLTATIN